MARLVSSPGAPFRQYKKTDSQVFQDGMESARFWRSHWNHLPGGPWVPNISDYDRQFTCQDWLEHCETLKRHNRIWLQGWHDGMKLHHPAQYKRIVGKAVYDKLAA